MPTNKVNIGVKLFSIPAKPDDIPVDAYVNRKAGPRFPHTPTVNNKKKFLTEYSFFKELIAKGKSTIAANKILKVAT